MTLVSAEYVKPLRCGFTIMDRTETTPFYTWDPWLTDTATNELKVQSISLSLSEGGNATANITLFDEGVDNGSTFDIKNGMIRGSVIFEIGKRSDQISTILHAFNPKLTTRRPDTNLMYRTIQCEG